MAAKRPHIFVIQSFAKESDAVYSLISSAGANAGAAVFRVDSIVAGSHAQGIHDAIRDAPLLIADVTNANPNVMFEVGLAQALNKALILISASGSSIPFDLAGARVSIYDPRNTDEFVYRLARTIELALKNPEEWRFSQVIAEREKRQNVFISYSHRDKSFLDRLLVHLKPLEKQGLIDLWVDTRIRPGDRWKKEIEKALQRATVAVLLVSADFLASDFITDDELPPILRNAEERGTRILPLVVRPCRFSRDNTLRHFQAINDPKSAMVLLTDGEQEVYYDQVAAEVERSQKS